MNALKKSRRHKSFHARRHINICCFQCFYAPLEKHHPPALSHPPTTMSIGNLLRAAIPLCWKDGSEWVDYSQKLRVNGREVPNEEAPVPPRSYWKLGIEIRVTPTTFFFETWTVENSKVQLNASFIFARGEDDLVFSSAIINCFSLGFLTPPEYDAMLYLEEMLEELQAAPAEE